MCFFYVQTIALPKAKINLTFLKKFLLNQYQNNFIHCKYRNFPYENLTKNITSLDTELDGFLKGSSPNFASNIKQI